MPLIPDPFHKPALAPVLFLNAIASGGETVGRVFPLWPFLETAGDLTTRESMLAAFIATTAQFEAQSPLLQVGEADAYALRLAQRRVFFVDCPKMDSAIVPQSAFASLALTDYPGFEGPQIILGSGIEREKAALAMLNHPDMIDFLARVDEGAAAYAAMSFSSDAKSLEKKIAEMRAERDLARIGLKKAQQRQDRRTEILTFGEVNRPAQKAPVLAMHIQSGRNDGYMFNQADDLMIVELPLPETSSWMELVPRSDASADDFLAMAQSLLRGCVGRARVNNPSAFDDLGGEAWIDQLKASCCGGRWTLHAKVEITDVSVSTRSEDPLSERIRALGHAFGGLPWATLGLLPAPMFERRYDPSSIPQIVQAISLIERERSGAKLDVDYASLSLDTLASEGTRAPVLALLDKLDMSLSIGLPDARESVGRSKSITL